MYIIIIARHQVFILLAAAYNERGWLVEGLVTMTVHGYPSLVSRPVPWLHEPPAAEWSRSFSSMLTLPNSLAAFINIFAWA